MVSVYPIGGSVNPVNLHQTARESVKKIISRFYWLRPGGATGNYGDDLYRFNGNHMTTCC